MVIFWGSPEDDHHYLSKSNKKPAQWGWGFYVFNYVINETVK
jgi:hypothetical protein